MEMGIIRPTSTEQSQNNASKKEDLDSIIKAKEQNERNSEINSRVIQYNLSKHQITNNENILN